MLIAFLKHTIPLNIGKKMKLKILAAITCLFVTGQASAELVSLNDYNNVLFVSDSGRDGAAGTQSDPFKTVQEAILAANQSGDAISISGGEYDITQTGITSAYNNSGLNNAGKDIDFIGVAGETFLKIDGKTAGTRDLQFYSGKGFSKIYGMTFIRDSNFRTTNYMNAFFGTNNTQGEFYNTVFKTINTGGQLGLTYANSGGVNVKVFNSVFDLDVDFSRSYSGQSPNMVIKDSVSNQSFFMNDGSTVYDNVVSKVTFDENYNITSPTDIEAGIYSGKYSWSDVSVPAFIGAISLLGLGFRRKVNKD